MNKTAVVIPAHNETKHIKNVLEKTKKYADVVILVDDGSTDDTYKIAKSIGDNVIALRHKINLGKGGGLKTGCMAAEKLGADIIVTLDADGQHPPEYIPEIIQYMEKQKLDVAFSFRKGGDKMPLVRNLGNRTLNYFAKYLFNLNLKDLWCGFRAFKTSVLPKISWNKSDYSGEVQMALKVGKNNLSYGEYEIPTIYHDDYKGVHVLHGLKLLAQMIIWRIIKI